MALRALSEKDDLLLLNRVQYAIADHVRALKCVGESPATLDDELERLYAVKKVLADAYVRGHQKASAIINRH
jgi:hypothetical protein